LNADGVSWGGTGKFTDLDLFVDHDGDEFIDDDSDNWIDS